MPLTAAQTPTIDEMVDGQGRVRSQWHSVLGTFSALPKALLQDRLNRLTRHLQEAGLTERPSADGRKGWQVDLVPMVLASREWESLSQGLEQRARLLNALLQDLYGPQTVLTQGLYPAYLVHANPRFLRAMRYALPQDRPALQSYAADLIRGPDGQWRVTTDRLDAPSGAGLALENRKMLARAVPELFRSAPVRRLRPFFDLWQQSLQALAGPMADNPRMALLSPGPYSQTYAEHALLARELNLTLTEGADLTARGERIYAKSLSGLHPVDIIMRRIDSEYADPLELRQDSALGVCGMVQAIRNRRVVVTNALGAGLLETPAMAAFLPALSQHLLGEDLLLPSLQSWWCGNSSQRQAGLSTLENRLIRPVYPSMATEALDPSTLDAPALSKVLADIDANPAAYVVQEKPQPSTTPIWSMEQGMDARPLVLRMFLSAQTGKREAPQRYQAMPGGFARVCAAKTFAGLKAMSLSHGGICKDVWVLADHDGDMVVPAPPQTAPLTLKRSAGELPSRIADNLYWLGRYAERADNAARLLRAALTRLAEGSLGPRERSEVTTLSALISQRGLIARPLPAALADGPIASRELMSACRQGQALDQLLISLQRLVPGVRNRLSADLLHVLGPQLEKTRRQLTQHATDMDSTLDALGDLIVALAALGGMVAENMTRHAGWRFLDMGRKLERAQFAAWSLAELSKPAQSGPTEPSLRLALELCDSAITYRSRYRNALQPAAVLDVVVADGSNPRALAYQIQRLSEHLDAMDDPQGAAAAQTALRLTHAALASIWRLELELVNGTSHPSGLGLSLNECEAHLSALNDAITRTYFSHVPPLQALGYGLSNAPDRGEEGLA